MDGTEVPHRLKNSPIKDYEQITALLRDGRGHEGMDFKTPVGTQTVSPKAGTVVRTNWNTSYNGNCLEVQFSDGVLAKWLHMEEVSVKPGQKLPRGVVGASETLVAPLHLTCTINSIRASVCLIQSSITTPPVAALKVSTCLHFLLKLRLSNALWTSKAASQGCNGLAPLLIS